jgi:predicted outer membrane protein
MERRILLAGLAAGAALATGSARAQSSSPAGPTPSLSDAAKTHVRDTMAAGAQSLAISRIALGKLKHPMGRQFAGFETAEQEGVADVLKARMAPGTRPSGAVAPPTDADLEAALDDDGKAAAAKFRDMAAGPEFEKAYIQAQVEGHRKLLGIQDAYLGVADDETETAIAKLVRGRIQEHLTILGDIGKHLG